MNFPLHAEKKRSERREVYDRLPEEHEVLRSHESNRLLLFTSTRFSFVHCYDRGVMLSKHIGQSSSSSPKNVVRSTTGGIAFDLGERGGWQG
mmetsp:Transcript_31983/g.76403  ORF Transcript_31983/g.76403 Transcript_31983/m.76403 type:complete len:92 (+) Transcript_31983:1258-1533(+)